MARDKTVSTSPTTMGKHGRLREEEAAREKSVKFGEFDEEISEEAYREVAKPAAKPVEKAPEPKVYAHKQYETAAVELTGPMLIADVQAALSDRYPHNDLRLAHSKWMEINVPGGIVTLDLTEVNKCKNTAELRAYIDALPIQ